MSHSPLLIYISLRILCVLLLVTLLSLSLSLSHIHTRTYHLFRCTESTTILYMLDTKTKKLENFGSLCFSFSFSIMLSVFFLFDVTWNISCLSELARATQKRTFTRGIAIANNSVQFESVKLKLFKTELFKKVITSTGSNRTIKPFKPNCYKQKIQAQTQILDIFKPLKPRFHGSVLVSMLDHL